MLTKNVLIKLLLFPSRRPLKKKIHSSLTIINFMQRMKHVCCKRYLNRKWGELFTTTATDNEDNNNTTSCFWPIQHVPFKFICSSREIDSEPFKYSYLTTQLHLLVSFDEQKVSVSVRACAVCANHSFICTFHISVAVGHVSFQPSFFIQWL